MALQIRRVVTGHDASGRAVVKIDEVAKNLVSSRPGATACVVWTTEGFPVDNTGEKDAGLRKTGTTLDNGTVFRILELAPGVTPRNHRTDSIDYAVVMSGEVDMELDDTTVHLKAGDVLVQRGTIHNWVNRGTAAPLGYIVEDRILRRVLAHRARSIPNLLFLAPLAVDSVSTTAFGATAALSNGRRFRVRLVAAADGRESPLRRAAGIRTVEWQYPQTGIVTTVRHQRPHNGIAVEHFMRAGPFAILPMTGTRSSIVWTERAELAPRLIALSDVAFAAELAARFGDFLGPVG